MDAYLRKRCPELEEPLLAAIDAFDAVQSGHKVSEARIVPLVAAASSERVPLYENATNLLGRLIPAHEIARRAVARMAKDSQAHVRFNAVLCIPESNPGLFGRDIVREALVDSSARVREKAADWASRCRMRDLLPDLRERLKAETNEKVRRGLAYSIEELR